MPLLDDHDISAGLTTLPAWRRHGKEIHAVYRAPDFPSAIALVDAVAIKAEAANHHPDIDIRWTSVTFMLSTHSAGGLTELDLVMAREIDDAASAAAARPQT
jgi:4a-hydroxytetrahydrobiopterin dehydratase